MNPVGVIAVIAAIIGSAALYARPAYAAPEGIAAQSLSLTDAAGNGQLKRIKPGGQFMASMAVTNTAVVMHEYVAVYEVRDGEGYTVRISFSEGIIGPGQTARIREPIVLEEIGEYTVRSFAYSVPAFGATRDSIVFSSIVTSTISVQEISYDHRTGVFVPLFEYPFADRMDSMWKVLAEKKSEHPDVPFAAVINPHSGPGVWQDPNYVRGIGELRQSGIEYVLGYVSTDYAGNTSGKTLADIKYMIDRYREWYPDVNGIMLDEVNSGASQLAFYTELVAYARSIGFEYIVANPGTRIAEEYVDVFDYLIIYENRVLPSVPQLQENTYYPRHYPEKFGFAVKNVASLDVGYVDEVREYVGFLYMTDDVESASDPSPYNTLPSYFADLVRFLDGSV
jgi:hypothetical protein